MPTHQCTHTVIWLNMLQNIACCFQSDIFIILHPPLVYNAILLPQLLLSISGNGTHFLLCVCVCARVHIVLKHIHIYIYVCVWFKRERLCSQAPSRCKWKVLMEKAGHVVTILSWPVLIYHLTILTILSQAFEHVHIRYMYVMQELLPVMWIFFLLLLLFFADEYFITAGFHSKQ